MSLVKHLEAGTIAEDGQRNSQLSFSRVREDGMPFRGPTAMLREDEYDELTDVTNDGFCKVFDMSVKEQSDELNNIVNKAANGWYQIYRLDHEWSPQPDGSVKVFVFCIWTVPYRELANDRVPSGLLTPA